MLFNDFDASVLDRFSNPRSMRFGNMTTPLKNSPSNRQKLNAAGLEVNS